MAAGALVVAGCALQSVDLPSAPPRGALASRPGRPGFVVGAPGGGGELPTDAIAGEIARRTGFGLVVASGPGPDHPAYEQRVLQAAQGPLRFYAEIHGAGPRECAGRIDIATVGVDDELARRLRTLAELIRDAHLRVHRDVQRLDVQVEPAAARGGVLRLPQQALQIELPRCASRDWRETYTSILADFLAQAVALPPGR